MKLNINKDDCMDAHTSFYEDGEDFIAFEIQRCGSFDVFPFSMAYGLSDFGSWHGIVSTNGKVINVTKGAWLDSTKTNRTWKIEYSEILSVKKGITKFNLELNNQVSGLTNRISILAPWFLIFSCGVAYFLFLKPKTFSFRVIDHFDIGEKITEAFSLK